MNVLVAGASGHVGAEIVAELKRNGHRVRALTRRQGRLANVAPDEIVVGDLNRPETLDGACQGVDAVVSAAGARLKLGLSLGSATYHAVDYKGNLNLLHAAQQAEVEKFVYVSVFSVPEIEDLAYIKAHREFAEKLKVSDLEHAVVQPTGFFSAFDAFLQFARLGVAPLIGTGEALTNPIHERDLASVCVRALEEDQGEIPVGGPDVLSRRALFEAAFAALGKKPRFVRVPDAVIGFNRRAVSLIDPRLGQLLAFLSGVSRVDGIAPCVGTRRIQDYFTGLGD